MYHAIDVKGAVYSALFHARSIFTGLYIIGLGCAWAATAGADSLPVEDCPPPQISETARVSHVHDGDTLRLDDGRKIRLIGIDTPELASNRPSRRHPAQPYANEAKAALVKFLQQSDSRIGLSYGAQRQDRYQRTLAHLYLPDGRSLQAFLLSNGYATAFTTPPNDSRSSCYRRLEARAREQQLGIWSLPAYRVKTLYQLTPESEGFSRVEGQVARVQFTRKAVWIHMGTNLRLRIDNRDLAYFNLHQLQNLHGKTIRVRGWLHRNKDHFFMALRHADALSTV